MSELWSAQQHGWLAALGHTAYAQGELPEETPAAVAPTVKAAARGPVRTASAPRRAPEPAPESPAPRGPAPRPSASRPPDRLHIALIRAAGCNPGAPGMDQVMAAWPSADDLRGDPAAKRALWPRLRALRRPAVP